MAFVVEDGTGLPNANSYLAVADADAYHADQGNTAWVGEVADKQSALVRATMYVDASYRGRFPGYPTTGRTQSREWPRVGAYVRIPEDGRNDAFFTGYAHAYAFINGVYYIPQTEIPREIKAAVCEGALRELTDPGSLTPDLDRGNAISRLKAGPVEIAYSGAATATTVFQTIDLALASLLMPASPYGGKVARG
jgi:hypothetical protein